MSRISTIGQSIDNSARLRTIQAQLYEMQGQLTTGKKTQQFSGLGTQAIGSQKARAMLAHIEVYQTNIDVGITRSKQMYQAVAEFRAQAENVVDTMQDQMQQGDIDMSLIKQFAQDGLRYLRELLNSKDGDRFLFAGSDAYTQPISDSGSHGTYMEGLFSDWVDGTITTDQLLTNYEATPESTMGYSATLSSGGTRNVFVRADVNSDVDYTVFANDEGFKDILNALALIDKIDLDKISLDEGDDASALTTAPGATREEQQENFFRVYEAMIVKINEGMGKVIRSEQKLNRVELELTSIKESHKTDSFNLETAVSNIEDIDPTDIAVKINALQIQLTAAYQVTARIGQLTLSQYL